MYVNTDLALSLPACAAALLFFSFFAANYPSLRRIQFHMAQEAALAQEKSRRHMEMMSELLRRIVPAHVVERGAEAVNEERLRVAAVHPSALELLRSAQMGNRMPTSLAVVDEYLDLVVLLVRLDPTYKWRGAVKVDALRKIDDDSTDMDDIFQSPTGSLAGSRCEEDDDDDAPQDGKGILSRWAAVSELIAAEAQDFLEHVQTLGDTFMLAGPFEQNPRFESVQRAALAVVRILGRMDEELKLRFTAVCTIDEGTGALVGRGALRYGLFGVSVRHCQAFLRSFPSRTPNMPRPTRGVAFATRGFVVALEPGSAWWIERAVPAGVRQLNSEWVTSLPLPTPLFELPPSRWRVRSVGSTRLWKLNLTAALEVVDVMDDLNDRIVSEDGVWHDACDYEEGAEECVTRSEVPTNSDDDLTAEA